MGNSPHLVHEHEHHADNPAQRFLRRGRWVFWAFVAIAAAFLLSEHRAHTLRALPYLIILACPLLHIFMHGGHGHGGHDGHGDDSRPAPPPASPPLRNDTE
jgi:hypothetical protein